MATFAESYLLTVRTREEQRSLDMEAQATAQHGSEVVTQNLATGGPPAPLNRGGWSKYNEAEKVVMQRLRGLARRDLPRALKVWIDGLSDSDKWFRHRCAAELCNRFGLPAMTAQHVQVDTTQVQVMVFPFSNPYPPAQPVEVLDVVDEAPDPGEQQGTEGEAVAQDVAAQRIPAEP